MRSDDKPRHVQHAKDADLGMSQKGKRTGCMVESSMYEDVVPPGKSRHLTFHVIYVKHGKPVSPPLGAGQPQGRLLEVRVEEFGKSESRFVMKRIGVERNRHYPTRKRADFRMVSLCERV